MMNFQWTPLSKNFQKTLHVSATSLPKHNSSTDLPSELPAELLSAPPHLGPSGRPGSTRSAALQLPLRVLRRGHRSFTIRVRSRDEVVAISRFKACTAADTTPGSPRRRSRLRVCTQAVLPQPSGSLFQTRWFLHILFWRCHEMVPEPFSYPARRFLHARDRRRHHRCHRHSTSPVNGHCHRGWTSDLFSSQPRPELGGSPVDTCLCPWQRSDQLGVLQ
jgi:hypothetical protein